MYGIHAFEEIYEIENSCLKLYDIFDRLKQKFNINEDDLYFFLKNIGHSSESQVSKEAFSNRIINITSPNTLYIQDCEALIAYIQECCIEITQLVSKFYETLNNDLGLVILTRDKTGTQTVKSPETNLVFSLLSSTFIKISSLLDYITKIAFETIRCPLPIEKYKKLLSRDKLYGKYKELNIENCSGTIFEDSNLINTIISIRDYIIHHGYIDERPKVYHKLENWACVEKYILMPDINESGRLENCVNRTLFYSQEVKLNELLPDMIREIFQRVHKSIEVIIRCYETQNIES
ncbi:TPA: hypothetical protein MD649_004263 [Klebsiella pneumoniae]|nr:hypothetical protein [Klebsiella pneumoniae]